MPAYLATARTTTRAVGAGRPRPRDGMRPAPGSARDPGAVTIWVGSGTGQLETLGHCWATTVSAVFCCAMLGKVIPPAGAGGRAAYAVLSSVPAETRDGSSIGPGTALRKKVLASVGVQVLLPQPCGGGVRRVLADRLVVVRRVVGVRRDDDLEVLVLGADLRGQQVVPPDQDRGLPALHRRGAAGDRH